MAQTTGDDSTRFLNHTELVYAPGDRSLARDLFRALGCRVLDPQEEEGPPELGPAAGPYLIVFVDPGSTDLIDNVMYASEVTPAQWAFEEELRRFLDQRPQAAASRQTFLDRFGEAPQAMTHFGLAMSEDQLEKALVRIEETAALAGRVRVSGPYRPGEAGSVDPRVIQAFLYTDIVSGNLLVGGQQIELQVRLG
jgi:hypothetical protein